MTRIGLLALVAVLSLGACAGTGATQFSHTPKTEVVVKGGHKKKPAQANYRVSPEESRVNGSGGAGQ